MPTKRAGTCAVAVGKKILAMGGVSTTQAPLDVVEIYDIDSNEWTTGDSLKDKVMGLSAVVRGENHCCFKLCYVTSSQKSRGNYQ